MNDHKMNDHRNLSSGEKPNGRRRFLNRVGGAVAAGAALSAAGSSPLDLATTSASAQTCEVGPPLDRIQQAFDIRVAAAQSQREQGEAPHPCNGDETRFADTRIGSYTKALPHNAAGFVDQGAYRSLLEAVSNGDPALYEAIILGGAVRQTDPQAGLAFTLEGGDSAALQVIARPPRDGEPLPLTPFPAAPRYDSAEEAGEMVELYWQALTRDVPFANYSSDPTIAAAVTDINRLRDFRGPRVGGQVTPGTIFRGTFLGDLTGPYVSQFLTQDVPYGAFNPLRQQIRTATPNVDFMTTYANFLNVQNGMSFGSNTFDPTRRYIRNARDLGEYVHRDFAAQAFTNAALIINAIGGSPVRPIGADLPGTRTPTDFANPYNSSRTQFGFVTFGINDIIGQVCDVASSALRAAWYQKWQVHRRLRPEEFGGHVDNYLGFRRGQNNRTGFPYPIHPDVLNSSAVNQTFSRFGSYLLPQAFPEGSPTHTSYPSGHAVYAGACVTVLKAFYDENAAIPIPRVASADGLTLTVIRDQTLTIGNELNKLASNIAFGRNAAGVHWRTDGRFGLLLGEHVAIRYLQDLERTYNQSVRGTFGGFTFTPFMGGGPITI